MNQASRQAALEEIVDYIADNFLYMRPDLEIESDTSLLTTDIVDSMGVVELVQFLEETFGIDVDNSEITEGNFESPETLARYVEAKRNGGARE